MNIVVSMIVAAAQNRVIGKGNKLPWHLPGDMQYFRQVTMGKPIIMGRNTFESLKKPLPGRTNIVVTRQSDYQVDGVRVVNSLESAIELAESIAIIDGVDEVMVIGGAEIYQQALPLTARLYLTEVHAEVDGDTYFPDFPRQQWREIQRDDRQAEPYDFSFLVLEKLD